MLKISKTNEKGVVFITVLAIIIITMILTISIISLNVSQVMVTEREARRIVAEQFCKGCMEMLIANQLIDPTSNYYTETVQLGNIEYTCESALDTSGTGPFGEDALNCDIQY